MMTIKEQFDKVIAYSQQGIPEPNTDNLFDKWRTNKAKFIEAFNGELIYEFPEKVYFTMDDEFKIERINEFLNYVLNKGYDKLCEFITVQKDGFYKNSVVEEYKLFDEKNTIITKNTKLLRSFKYFISDKNDLNDIQSKASQIIQECKIEGRLCLSVHPLDYLSVSENNYNWRSCHALDGEYRAGNLSYMMDSTTIVCYLKGEDDVKLPRFPSDVPWNNKKWRVLLYLSNDWNMIFAGRQYPFAAEGGMKIVLDKILNEEHLFNKTSESQHPWVVDRTKGVWMDWTTHSIDSLKLKTSQGINVEYDFNEYIPVNDGLIELPKMVKDAYGSKQFNDVLKSTQYTPQYTQLVLRSNWSYSGQYFSLANRSTSFTIGESTYCLRCGKEEVIDACSTMMCYNCELNHGVSENENFGFCSCCGARIEIDTAHYVGDDMTYCEACYREYAETCANCGEAHLRETMAYDCKNDEYYCRWCDIER